MRGTGVGIDGQQGDVGVSGLFQILLDRLRMKRDDTGSLFVGEPVHGPYRLCEKLLPLFAVAQLEMDHAELRPGVGKRRIEAQCLFIER